MQPDESGKVTVKAIRSWAEFPEWQVFSVLEHSHMYDRERWYPTYIPKTGNGKLFPDVSMPLPISEHEHDRLQSLLVLLNNGWWLHLWWEVPNDWYWRVTPTRARRKVKGQGAEGDFERGYQDSEAVKRVIDEAVAFFQREGAA